MDNSRREVEFLKKETDVLQKEITASRTREARLEKEIAQLQKEVVQLRKEITALQAGQALLMDEMAEMQRENVALRKNDAKARKKDEDFVKTLEQLMEKDRLEMERNRLEMEKNRLEMRSIQKQNRELVTSIEFLNHNYVVPLQILRRRVLSDRARSQIIERYNSQALKHVHNWSDLIDANGIQFIESKIINLEEEIKEGKWLSTGAISLLDKQHALRRAGNNIAHVADKEEIREGVQSMAQVDGRLKMAELFKFVFHEDVDSVQE